MIPLPAPRCARAAVVGATLLLPLGACANAFGRNDFRGVAGRPSHIERLYFGRNRGSVEVVSDSAWALFLREVVTPRFPDGLTVWGASGQWQGAGGEVARERSFVLEIVHVLDRSGETRIEAVIDEYKRRFRQEAVLRVVTVGRANL